MEEVEHLRHTSINKEIYDMGKETIERVFADMKEKHGMRWTTLRGLGKVKAQAMLIVVCMNLKKMANWMWRSGKDGPNPSNPCTNLHGLIIDLYSFIIILLKNTIFIIKKTVFFNKMPRLDMSSLGFIKQFYL
ncbi:transposase (fragment) [[Clostridium] ultunense Esp]|uniref:Transposase n=1 Tax=[Clostridium] ultunense Esp TaxID=1288971 RepID=A0A1M4PKG3_9FIRM